MPFIGKELRAIADRNKDSTLIEYLKVITPQWMKDTLGVRGNAQQVHNEQAAVNHAVSEVARRIVTGTGLGGTTDTSVVVNQPPPPTPPHPLNPPLFNPDPPEPPVPDEHSCDIDLVIYMAIGWGRWDWDTVQVVSSLGLTLAFYDRNDASPGDTISGPNGTKIHFIAVNIVPPNYQAHAKVLTVSDDGSTCSRTQTNR
jgi:hypothetical protein